MDFKKQAEILEILKKQTGNKMKVISCLRFDESSKIWNTDRHSHEYLEILYFLKGEAMVEGEKSHTSVQANHAIIYPPSFVHKEHIDFSKSQEIYCISIETGSDLKIEESLTVYDVHQKIEWIIREIHLQDKDREISIMSELLELLFSYLKKNCESGATAYRAIVPRVKEYISSHYSAPVSQSELCDLVHVSPSYLIRTFKKETGQTPVAFLNQTRIEKASLLLRNRNLTVEAIGAEVGIPDQKYFSKVFKKVTGTPPREFRENQLS